MRKKLWPSLKFSRHPAGHKGKFSLWYVAKLDVDLRFGRPSAEDFYLTVTVRIVKQDQRILLNPFSDYWKESVAIAWGRTWWAVANDQFEGLRHPVQRRIVPPKIAVIAKWSEANVGIRNAISPYSQGYLRVPLWHMLQRPGFYSPPSGQPSQQYGCQSAPAFENRAISGDSSVCHFFKVISVRCKTLISPSGLKFNQHLAAGDFTNRKANQVSHGATKSKVPYRLPRSAFHALGNQRF
jgi:hypothetical protein